MIVYIGSDHAGYDLKEYIKQVDFEQIIGFRVDFIDVGTRSKESCDYPYYAKILVKLLKKKLPFRKAGKQKTFGILICGTGFGMSMVANRFRKIRAVVCRNEEDAKIARKHNNANVICIGERATNKADALESVVAFLTTPFEGGRHTKRIKMF